MLLVTKRFLYYFCLHFSNVKLDLINNHKQCLLNLNFETVRCKYITKINFSLIGSKFFIVANFIVILGIVIVLQLKQSYIFLSLHEIFLALLNMQLLTVKEFVM
jgi:hypothetical protein